MRMLWRQQSPECPRTPRPSVVSALARESPRKPGWTGGVEVGCDTPARGNGEGRLSRRRLGLVSFDVRPHAAGVTA